MCPWMKVLWFNFTQKLLFEIPPIPNVNVVCTRANPSKGTPLISAHVTNSFSANHRAESEQCVAPNVFGFEVQ
jgi:hypothetical protein